MTEKREHRAPRIRPGDHLPDRELTSIRGETVTLPDPHALTHLQLRRFASCPICNVHLGTFVRREREIAAADVTEIVVFHSSVEAMLPHQGALPFVAVADPERSLYDEFGVTRGARSVLDPRSWTAPLKPAAWAAANRERHTRGAHNDRPDLFGFPADFLVAPEGRVLAAKYGTYANDQWSVDDVLALAARHRGTLANG
ncbi:AhpC/TSA family protein [Spiractinospora alimapuensis]|uniref:peroxiredoxin-like family protein n=1 Tax=Spiractinospora alimapuensis TaxID=2820884 RepID=UPI001F33324D|nr:peroxiredoxin-like family protein [Spiractinospora alimapuensis]QVQ51573.1 AhpC/TSA family protein [Spiractinospora alimapuensis]